MVILENANKDLVGYKLLDCGSHFELHFKGGYFRGNWQQVKTYAMFQFDFDEYELHLGMREMLKHGHNGAEYGILCTFMWTFNTKLRMVM
jgi:hypothetical protein